MWKSKQPFHLAFQFICNPTIQPMKYTLPLQVYTSTVCTWTVPAGIVATPACWSPHPRCSTPYFRSYTSSPSTRSVASRTPCTSAPCTRSPGVRIWHTSSRCCWRPWKIPITGFSAVWRCCATPNKENVWIEVIELLVYRFLILGKPELFYLRYIEYLNILVNLNTSKTWINYTKLIWFLNIVENCYFILYIMW